MGFLDLFGGWKPQPKKMPQTPEDIAAHKFHYLRLPDRISLANRGATAIDEFYPKVFLSKITSESP